MPIDMSFMSIVFGYAYRFILQGLVFSSNINHNTSQTFIVCSVLNNAKKAIEWK